MATYAAAVAEVTGKDNSRDSGAGAAGGMGFALMSFFEAEMLPGAELVMQVTGLSECMKDADVFLTGEGRMDCQTTMGKAPWLAAQVAKRVNPRCKVYAFAGQIKGKVQTEEENRPGYFDGIYAITPTGMPISQAMQTETAKENMHRAVTELKFDEKRRD